MIIDARSHDKIPKCLGFVKMMRLRLRPKYSHKSNFPLAFVSNLVELESSCFAMIFWYSSLLTNTRPLNHFTMHGSLVLETMVLCRREHFKHRPFSLCLLTKSKGIVASQFRHNSSGSLPSPWARKGIKHRLKVRHQIKLVTLVSLPHTLRQKCTHTKCGLVTLLGTCFHKCIY